MPHERLSNVQLRFNYESPKGMQKRAHIHAHLGMLIFR